MSLEVRHLQMVQAVHEEKTVTRAAVRLNLTQSALSHQLRSIEETLGATLFQRLGKFMSVTPAGERLLTTAAAVLSELKEAERDISQQVIAPDGVLRISTECYTCYHWLPARMKTFRTDFPRVEIRIVVEATHQPLQALMDGTIDLGIVTTHFRNARIAYSPLFRDELVVIVSPQHRLAGKGWMDAQDFADEHLIAYSVPREQLTIFQDVLVPAGVTPRAVSHMQLTEAMIEMVKSGIGVAVLARWAVRPYVEKGDLVALSLTRKGVHRQWSAATIRGRTVPLHLTRFLKMLSAEPIVQLANMDKSGRRRK